MDYHLLIYILIFLAAFAVLLPLYLRAEDRIADGPHTFQKAAILKVATSGLCALCALLGLLLWSVPPELARVFIPIALICSVVGDYFLQYIALDEKRFTIGILFFALTQVFLIVSLCLHHGVSWPEFVITAVLACGVWALVTTLKWKLGKTKVPLICYAALLIFMASKSVLALFAGAAGAANAAADTTVGITLPLALMAAGAVLFVISDSLLGIKYFSGAKESRSKLYLITYFLAILLIALSSLF